jgi:hypothetical protein
MSFPHDAGDFVDLLRVVAGERGLTEALVEKDYWVTHTLWSLSQSRLDVWFKGGTSLSKGFGLITRFSEDLDLKIDRGHLDALPLVKSWTSKNPGPTASRRAFYEALGTVLSVPGARVELDPESPGKEARTAEYKVLYPGQFLGQLAPPMRPFILLEVGHARVLPYVDLLGGKDLLAGFGDRLLGFRLEKGVHLFGVRARVTPEGLGPGLAGSRTDPARLVEQGCEALQGRGRHRVLRERPGVGLVDRDAFGLVGPGDAALLGGVCVLDLHGGARQLDRRRRRAPGFLKARPPVGLGGATRRAKLVLELGERIRAALLHPCTQFGALALAKLGELAQAQLLRVERLAKALTQDLQVGERRIVPVEGV